MKGWSFLAIAILMLGLMSLPIMRCNSHRRMNKIIDDAYRPTAVPTPDLTPVVEPTPEPTPAPTYYTVTLYSGPGYVKKWKVNTDTDFNNVFGGGVNFKDENGKDITIAGTYTIEED